MAYIFKQFLIFLETVKLKKSSCKMWAQQLEFSNKNCFSIVSSWKKRHNKKRLYPSDEKGDFFCSFQRWPFYYYYTVRPRAPMAPPPIHLSRYFTNLAFFFFFSQGCHVQKKKAKLTRIIFLTYTNFIEAENVFKIKKRPIRHITKTD